MTNAQGDKLGDPLTGVTLALDMGEKRIGVAVSDPLGMIASPLQTLHRTRLSADLEAIRAIVEARGVVRIVVGLPKTMRNEIGPQAQRTLSFVHELRNAVDCPVETWDERLTTAEATRILRQPDRPGRRRSPSKKRDRRRKENVDQVAAALILEAFLASRRT